MSLREVLSLRYKEDCGLPERSPFVVAFQSGSSVFGLADVDDRFRFVIALTEQEIYAWQIQFLA